VYVCTPAAFEKERLEAYRQKVTVMFGPQEARGCKTAEDFEDLLEEVCVCVCVCPCLLLGVWLDLRHVSGLW
jgi:hypothetical protein